MNNIYPVGSLYFATQSTCPLQSLGIGAWVNVGTSIITSVNTNVPVKGNGSALGLTIDGKSTFYAISGLDWNGSDPNHNSIMKWASTGGVLPKESEGSILKGSNDKSLVGITNDSSKSGIVGTVTRSSLTVNIFKRTA